MKITDPEYRLVHHEVSCRQCKRVYIIGLRVWFMLRCPAGRALHCRAAAQVRAMGFYPSERTRQWGTEFVKV